MCPRGLPDDVTIDDLVVRTFWFHGDAPYGKADASDLSVQARQMDETPPSAAEPKVDTTTPGMNDQFNGSPGLPYWNTWMEGERIVCAQAIVHAPTEVGLTGYLFVDQPYAAAEATTIVPGEAEGTGLGQHVFTFRRGLDDEPVFAEFDLTFQIFATLPTTVLYDSTDFDSHLTLLVVPPAE